MRRMTHNGLKVAFLIVCALFFLAMPLAAIADDDDGGYGRRGGRGAADVGGGYGGGGGGGDDDDGGGKGGANPIPEPTSVVLFVAGAAAMGGYMRSRQRR